MKAACIESKTLAKGKFLELDLLQYTTESGQIRQWEAAQRPGPNKAVLIAATLEPGGELVLIRQFRPPVNAYVMEMPAGIMEPGETARETAVRELEEETGYRGIVTGETGFCASSAGLTGELVNIVFMEIPRNTPENLNHRQNLQDSEEIQVIIAARRELREILAAAAERGDIIDSRLAILAAAQNPELIKNP